MSRSLVTSSLSFAEYAIKIEYFEFSCMMVKLQLTYHIRLEVAWAGGWARIGWCRKTPDEESAKALRRWEAGS